MERQNFSKSHSNDCEPAVETMHKTILTFTLLSTFGKDSYVAGRYNYTSLSDNRQSKQNYAKPQHDIRDADWQAVQLDSSIGIRSARLCLSAKRRIK